MANYKEQVLTGQKWVRSNRVTINHPYGGGSQIHFGEEEITLLSDGKTINTPLTGLTQPFDDPAVQFDLRNPETNEVIGSVTYADVYVMLYSLYIALATTRDLNQG